MHFDWEYESSRIKGLNAYFSLLEKSCETTEIIMGDFNDTPESNLHFELVLADFFDVHKEYSHALNQAPQPTLDIDHNPRWRNVKTDENPQRFDWIMLNTVNKYKITKVHLIGLEESNNLAPSDHYGVLSEIEVNSNDERM